MKNDLHEKVFLFLEEYRKENTEFRYFLRQKKDRLIKGFWFQGDEKYASIGFYPPEAGNNSTRSITLVFYPSETGIKWFFEIEFRREKRPEFLAFYRELISLTSAKPEGSTNLKFRSFFNNSDLAQVEEFLTNIKPQIDALILKHGLKEYFSLPDTKFQKMLDKVNHYRLEINKKQSEEKSIASLNSTALNQILYGPPGTGKTYHTVNQAIKIANPDFDLEQERGILKAEFDRLQAEGRIVFTTFHQSMSYEDFVEGIKPVFAQEENDSKLAYQIQDGIFKKLCVESAYSLLESNKTEKTEKFLDFSKVYDRIKDEILEELQEKESVKLTTKSGGKIIIDDVSAQGNFIIKHPDKKRTYTVSKARLAKLHTALGELSEISNFNDTCRSIIGGSNSSAYWAVLNKVREVQKQPLSIFTDSTVDKSVSYEDKKVAIEGLDKNAYSDLSIDNYYVLIIDEINRGNVSQIFGELITLIEPDKRQGKAEALELTLPYSKTKFGVPPNLYIIGTMNTADRSVEALDAALRRRFHFREMPPDANVIRKKGVDQIGDFNTADILETINNRLKILLDRDHLIGHSYFLKVKNIENLRHVFIDRIIPLLQEYFYGDYSKIALVLGKGFCDVDEQLSKNDFAPGLDDYSDNYAERKIFSLKTIDTTEKFIDALKQMIEQKNNVDAQE